MKKNNIIEFILSKNKIGITIVVSLFICGDIINYGHYDGKVCSEELSEIIARADISVCNLEAPLESNGKPVPKSGIHHYQRKNTISGLKMQGFNLILLANNHIMDFGDEGLSITLESAKDLEIDTLGAGMNRQDAYIPLIKTINGIKIGMINAGEAQFGVIDYYKNPTKAGYSWINHSLIDNNIISLKKECEFVIVFSHAGLENYYVPQMEWRQRYRQLCQLGADIVIGSHPHQPQGYEKYQDSLIFYSLGNFYFDSKNFLYNEDSSYSLWIDIDKHQYSFKPIFHHKNNGLVKLSSKTHQIDLEKLSLLLGNGYRERNDQMCFETYYFIKKNLIYAMLPVPYDGGIISSLRRIFSILLGRTKKIDKALLQLHLLRNESYYYAAKNALEMLARERFPDI